MNDLRFACRQLRKNPGFTSVAVLTLALGMGATTAIFSLMDHVMLRSLPARNPEELAVVPGVFTYPRFERIRDRNDVFSGVFGAHALPDMEVSLTGEAPTPATGELVSGSYFEVLGIDVVLGRPLRPEDDRAPEASPVVVISHGLWMRAFGGATDVLGRTIRVRSSAGYANTSGLDIYDGATARNQDGVVLTIVGVAQPDFSGEIVGRSTDVWIPMMMEPAVMPGRPWLAKDNVSWVVIMGRRKPGISEAQASAALTVLWRQMLMEEAGTQLTDERRNSIGKSSVKVASGATGISPLRNQFAQPLTILMAAVAMVLLIACLNVANLLIARGAGRRQEFGVRLAIGSGRGRLVRQLLIESLLLGMLGGILGLLVAVVGTRVLVDLVSSGYQVVQLPLRPDLRILGFTAALSLVTTVLFGLAPALRATRVPLAATLRDGARGTVGRAMGAGKFLVTVQVAASLVLLVGAGLFLRTLHNLRGQDVGYDREHLVMVNLDPVSAGYRGDDIGRVCQRLLERIAALPGVRLATYSENGLFGGPESRTMITVDGAESAGGPGEAQLAHFDQVGPGYFSKIGIPLLLGRDITERDGAAAPRVAVINETLARFHFPNGRALGQHFTTGDGLGRVRLEIVGVARDARDHTFRAEPVRRFYVPFLQPIDGITGVHFAMRTAGDVGGLAETLRREVQAVDRGLMLPGISDVKTLMNRSLVSERLMARLSAFFGLLAAFLAALGLYGVMAGDVARRTNEIGIRMALGAGRSTVVGMVMRNGLSLTLPGVAVGLAGAVALTQLIRSQLHGVNALDPLTFSVVVTGLVAVTMAACWLPARRAARLDPMKALRHE